MKTMNEINFVHRFIEKWNERDDYNWEGVQATQYQTLATELFLKSSLHSQR